MTSFHFHVTRTVVGDNGEYQDVILTLPVRGFLWRYPEAWDTDDDDNAESVLSSFKKLLQRDDISSQERKFLADAVRRMSVLDLTDCYSYMSHF